MQTRWEYLAVKCEPDSGLFSGTKLDSEALNETLNRLGSKGWELVSSFDVNTFQGVSQEIVLVFKRPLELT